MPETIIEVRPQPGPQEDFLACPADIAFYGGAAGGGKTYALLIEPLRHVENRKFGAVIFRRTTKQVRNEGGLWDESMALYGRMRGAVPKESTLEWKFKSGMRVQFAHLEYEKNVLDWQGAQVPLIGFDEVTHFTEGQFFGMVSRNRSTSGVDGYIRATCNPDKNSWVREFITWWIDEEGFAIPERCGVLRWFIRKEDKIHWADSKEELFEQFGAKVLPMSVTFIAAKLEDNKILEAKDPSYRARLESLSRVERARYLDGNWNIQPSAGSYFKRHEAEIVDAIPSNCVAIRFWDRAATEVSPSSPDPDWTVGLLLLKHLDSGLYFVKDVIRFRGTPAKVQTGVRNTARADGIGVKIGLFIDPGSAGKSDHDTYMKLLAGFNVGATKPVHDKETYAEPVSAQWEQGNVKVLRGAWNKDFLDEVNNFPDDNKDDQVDTLSGAFNMHNAENVGSFQKDNKQSAPQRSGPIAPSLGARKSW